MNRYFKIREDELTNLIYSILLNNIWYSESVSNILVKYYTERDLPVPENIDIWETAKMIVEHDYEEV